MITYERYKMLTEAIQKGADLPFGDYDRIKDFREHMGGCAIELYEALKVARACLADACRGPHSPQQKQIDAALAKAEGKAPK